MSLSRTHTCILYTPSVLGERLGTQSNATLSPRNYNYILQISFGKCISKVMQLLSRSTTHNLHRGKWQDGLRPHKVQDFDSREQSLASRLLYVVRVRQTKDFS